MNEQEWLGKDNQLGIDIWTKKYRYDGENFEQWLDRISGGNKDLRDLIRDKKFLFGGRILSNRGLYKKGIKVTYSNCYVITPPADSIESIFECASKMARTFSYGGGVGIDISNLAPKGSKVNNTAKVTSGSTSFMDLYSLVTGLIGQNGRRGALMISISCEHPDVEEFIGIKTDLKRVTKANISVRVTNRFMEAVKKKENFVLSFTRPETGETLKKTVSAYALFSKLAQTNWDYAEPGCLFWDRISDWNLLSKIKSFSYAGTNPCAEEPLPAGGSCLLGSMNLAAFVTKEGQFDYGEFRRAVAVSIDGLNEALEEGLPLHPLKEQQDSVSIWRQVGLGIFGLADMLIAMKVRYGSEEAIRLCDSVGRSMINAALQESALLAKKYGPFKKCSIKQIMASDFFKANADPDTKALVEQYGLRNSQLLTIAPTGSLSSMIGISGGIEPIFANFYERKTESLMGHDQYYKVYTPVVKEYMDAHNIQDDSELPDWFVTAQNLNYHERIDMQAIWQTHIDAAISSTVNVPEKFTVDDTKSLYVYAWEKGLKGITIFRDKCKRVGILSAEPEKPEEKKEEKPQGLKRGYILGVNDNVIGKKRKLTTGCGSLHCTAFFDPTTGDLLETYLSKGSTGGCNNFMIGLSRMISLAARGGISIEDIIDQLDSCGSCPSYTVRYAKFQDTSKGSCCPMAVGNALRDMYEDVQRELKGLPAEPHDSEKKEHNEQEVLNPCPQCGSELVFEGGCNICKNCGWTKCD
ncbi:MAG: adenosylcobalamin-dependent ribonucleoside-diphosphate reductase [Lachnospiraceae bacterium]|jgi:ribonucleoside-diphosphate reductase alpha chain|nr:adenosylcobalamin-dependent ribonucleoside-diphosphate reductase [Lachnospiraceae bacterium]MCI1727741.1 adenosylcobalamin-dependent ribonucleoside-diphosphate reductase [Lachnospiraceae bacterium]